MSSAPARIALAIALIGLIGCNEVAQHKAERTLTSTVTLTLEDTLAIDSWVPLAVGGERRIDQIFATLEATVTASTSTRAEALAAGLEIEVERRDRTVLLTVAKLDMANLEGTLTLRVPADLHVEAIERTGTIDVIGMDGNIRASSRSHVRITGAKGDVTAGVYSGNVLVDADLDPGSRIDLAVEGGDIELSVPSVISVDLAALVQTRGTITPAHPQLPPFFGSAGQIYRAVVGGGLSVAALQTNIGNIVIRAR
jgi:hypothetical protein